MKRLMVMAVIFLTMFCAPWAFAKETANIKINLSGVPQANRYFLCVYGVGCLSIRAAADGKVYRVDHSFRVGRLFVTDVARDLRLYRQGYPSSCHVRVKRGQTITISGHIMDAWQNVRIQQLRCSVN